MSDPTTSDVAGREPARARNAAAGGEPGGNWERSLLERIALASVTEQRRARRWRIFFRLTSLAIVVALGAALLGPWGAGSSDRAGRHTALVDLDGVIESGSPADAESINAALEEAFEDAKTAGIVLRINSPGGSPVQASLMYDQIRRLRAKHPNIPLYAVVEEIGASGGYYVAAAADRIYVDKSSIVGSIGVLMGGFGFTGLIDKLGVERRLLTAGENKGFLDPFSPVDDAQRQHAKKMLAEVHQQFIDAVRQGRGDRLKETPDMFSGLFWSGARGVELGLADALGSVDSVARDVIKAEEIVDFSPRENIAERFAKRIGAEVGKVIAARLISHGAAPTLR